MPRETTPAERFLLAILEDGDPWDKCSQGIYENLKEGKMDCDETGRALRLTEAGRRHVEELMPEIAHHAKRP